MVIQRILHLYGMLAIKQRLIGNRSVKEDATMKDYIRLAALVDSIGSRQEIR